MTDTFTPVFDPSTSSTRAVKSRVNAAQFGDGYGQRSADGLNAAPRSLSLRWEALVSTDADTIEAFFEAHDVDAFFWIMPLDNVPRKWIATEWSRGYVAADIVSLSASLIEVFDL